LRSRSLQKQGRFSELEGSDGVEESNNSSMIDTDKTVNEIKAKIKQMGKLSLFKFKTEV
jgi:hypothetical protein